MHSARLVEILLADGNPGDVNNLRVARMAKKRRHPCAKKACVATPPARKGTGA